MATAREELIEAGFVPQPGASDAAAGIEVLHHVPRRLSATIEVEGETSIWELGRQGSTDTEDLIFGPSKDLVALRKLLRPL